jgi:hypothetical protein
VFFQAPWALFAAWAMVHQKLWQHLRLRDALAVTVAVLCACVSLYVFWLDWASLGHVSINNSYRLAGGSQHKAIIWNFKVVLLACALALLAARAWFDLVSLAWLAAVIFTLREAYYWHLLISLSWIAAPARRPMVRGVRVAFLLFAMATVFSNSIVPSWLEKLYQAN